MDGFLMITEATETQKASTAMVVSPFLAPPFVAYHYPQVFGAACREDRQSRDYV